MIKTFPGMTVETSQLTRGSSVALFDGIFAAGGITLSQVSNMTGLEPYLIQNWVKRGFVSSPQKRLYSRGQFARIVIINMLRESLQIEKICGLIRAIDGIPDDESDNLIRDDELYHRYVDMVATGDIQMSEPQSVLGAAVRVTEDFEETVPGAKKQLAKILQIMLYAHAASRLRGSAEELLSSL